MPDAMMKRHLTEPPQQPPRCARNRRAARPGRPRATAEAARAAAAAGECAGCMRPHPRLPPAEGPPKASGRRGGARLRAPRRARRLSSSAGLGLDASMRMRDFSHAYARAYIQPTCTTF